MIGRKKGRGRRGAGEGGGWEKDNLFKWFSTSTTTNNYFMFINDEI